MQTAKTHLSRLVEEALAGEQIILAKAGKPQVALTPCRPRTARRKGGQLAAVLPAIPPDFDRADPQVQTLFEA